MATKPSRESTAHNVGLVAKPEVSVLIADRDSMTSQLIADALTRTRRYEALAVAPSELLRTLATRKVGLVVIGTEVNSVPGTGFDLAKAVSHAHPEVGVVLLLDQASRMLVLTAFRSGARGIFCRQQPMPELLDCIEHVCKGLIWAGATESTFLIDAFRSLPAPILSAASGASPLTTRELQVIECAAQGKTNKVIATALGLSQHTVKNYLFRAYEKLGVSSRIELLFYLTLKGSSLSEPVDGVGGKSVAMVD